MNIFEVIQAGDEGASSSNVCLCFKHGLSRAGDKVMGIFWRNQRDQAVSGQLSADEIRDWLIHEVATRLNVPDAEVDTSASLLEYGLDSLQATAISGRLERLLKRRLSPAMLWDHPTIDELTSHLTAETVAVGRT